jgi:glucokinase
MAGEIGHNVVRPGGIPCVCGKAGCVEAEACGWGIAAKTRARLQDEERGLRQSRSTTKDEGERLLALAGGRADGVTAQMVAQAAAEGDALAQELLYGAAEALGMGIGAALNLMNPQRVVLGGGITKSGERWWQIVRATARGHALPQTRAEIVPAAMGDDAPLWGAAALALSLV